METIKTIGSDSATFWYNSGITVTQNYTKSNPSEFNPLTGTSQKQYSYDKMIYELPEFKPEQIDCTYIGTPHACMCGCSGKYSHTKLSQVRSGKNRGYQVADEDVSDLRVKKGGRTLLRCSTAGLR